MLFLFLVFLDWIDKRSVGLVHEKSVKLFLLTVHNSFLYDQLTLFNQFDVPFNDDYQAKGDEGENFVLIQYALFCAEKVIAKQSCFLDVPLCDFSLLDYGANDVSWEDQKCSELKAVVVDYADQK